MGLRFLLPERITGRVEIDKNGCWVWAGAIATPGYGQAFYEKKQWIAHRLFFAAFNGELLPGNEIHHLCGVRACCNPFHLVQMTRTEHMIADGRAVFLIGGNCKRCGTPLEGENLYVDKDGRKKCKECVRRYDAIRYKKIRSKREEECLGA